jgi:hypothetical protein
MQVLTTAPFPPHRWVDRDGSGTISSGEYLRLMRQGWSGFLEEQVSVSLIASRLPVLMASDCLLTKRLPRGAGERLASNPTLDLPLMASLITTDGLPN